MKRISMTIAVGALLTLMVAAPSAAARRRAWVTSVLGNGNLSSWPEAGGLTGLAAGDAICRARAAAGGHPNASTYRAWLSDASTDAYCHVQGLTGKKANGCAGGTGDPAGPWYRFNGNTPMSGDVAALTGPGQVIYRAVLYDDLTHPVYQSSDSPAVWTGTTHLGEAEPGSHCLGWTSSSSSDSGIYGNALRSAQIWTYSNANPCGTFQRLLCVEPGASDPPDVRWATPGSIVFATTTSGSGDLSSWPDAGGATGLAAGDAICRAAAARAHLPQPESFVAWLSDSTQDARDRMTSNGPFFRIDGVRLAQTKADLLDGSLVSSIHQREDGSYVVYEGGGNAYTATYADGTGDAVSNCVDWTSASMSDAAWTGSQSSASDEDWTARRTFNCSTFLHLYCFSNATTLLWDGFDLTGDASRWSSSIP